MKLISIIIPVHNSEQYVFKTLESVLMQSHKDLEIIVIDDGSTDRSSELIASVAERDSRIRLYSQPNAGIAGARNAGFAHISENAEFVLFLDHDDLLLPNAVSALLSELELHPDAPAAHGTVEIIDESGRLAPESAIFQAKRGLQRRRLVENSKLPEFRHACKCDPSEPTSFAAFLYANCITSVGQVLFRRKKFEESGGFDPDVAPNDDLDLYLRVSLFGAFVYIDRPTLQWRMHHGNTSNDQHQMRQAYLKYWSKVVSISMPSEKRRLVRQMALYRFMTSVYDLIHERRHGYENNVWPYFRILLTAIIHDAPWSIRRKTAESG